jgi:penicillin-binding protein 1A
MFILERIEAKDGSVVWQSTEKRSRENVMKPEAAYEVHSCLVDALDKGTGAAARERLGLGQFPAAGKTGTAYDFTEALFAGYGSAITVAVRAGFDKPQKIYRGAFGSEIALPVWVDVMNASATRYPPREIPKPASVQSVEICSRSGMLATDKCGNNVYREIATKEQMPQDPCPVHGDARARVARDLPDAGVPRAALAVDTAQVKPVALKGPTLLADNDPYNAVKSTVRPPKPADPADNEVKPVAVPPGPAAAEVDPEDDPTVLRAVPVDPTETATAIEEEPTEVRRAEPVRRATATPEPEWVPRTETVPRGERVPRPTGTTIPRALPVNPRAPVRGEPVDEDDLQPRRR